MVASSFLEAPMAVSASVLSVEVGITPNMESTHPAERLGVVEVEACLRGEVAFPGEPADVTAVERAVLWNDEFSYGSWYRRVTAPSWEKDSFVVSVGMFYFVLGSASMGFAYLASPAANPIWGVFSGVGLLISALVGWKCWRKICENHLYVETCRLLNDGRWHQRWANFLRDIKMLRERNGEVPALLGEVAELAALTKRSSEFREKVGIADTVSILRLVERVRHAVSVPAKRVVIEGETEELLTRTFEALGGRHPVDEVRL